MTTANVKKSIKLKQAAQAIIRRRMLYAAGLGLIPIPVVDAAGILGIQVLMIKDLAKVYGISFKEHRVKSFIGSLVGSMGAMSAIKAIPVMGSILGAVAVSISGAASTYAIGKVFVQHFDMGGTLLDFDPVTAQKHFKKLYEEGEKEAARLKANETSKIGKFVKTIMPPKRQAAATVTEAVVSGKDTPLEAEEKAKKLKKAKRRKAIIAKRRKAARNKKIKKYALLLLVVGTAAYFYFQNKMKFSSQSTEIDLFMQEAKAKQVDLQSAGDLDSLTTARISQFSSNSTEGAIAKHIQRPKATYPKRFALSSVRFTGNSKGLSSGAIEQLSNIAFLMKKYPALNVNLYGHTSNVGPEFNRKRIGRERARSLRDIFANLGIPSYRITGNYIEKSAGTHDEYWGAEIVIDVSTEENAVAIDAPSMPSPRSLVPDFIKNIVPEKKVEPIPEPPIAEVKKEEEDSTITIAKQPVIDSSESELPNKKDAVIEEFEEAPVVAVDTPEVVPPIEEKVVEAPKKEVVIEEPKEAPTPPVVPKKEKEKAAPVVRTTEGVMRQYIESPNPKYPKVFSLSHIQFAGESEELADKGKKQLANIAQLLQEYSTLKVAIYGHTSGGGSQEMAPQEKEKLMLKWQTIGQKRARIIKKELNNNGISNRRMSVHARRQNKEPSEPFWGADIVISKK
ncbi:MAG: OmpA family protein [Saprospiraceae bacterium]